jgi:hypothetical protein
MAATRYAARTEVSSDRTRAEIETTLRRYGATAFGYAWEDASRCALLMFDIDGRRIRFRLPLPDRNDRMFTHTAVRSLRRDIQDQEAEYERAVRQRWRALALVIKAKLEAVTAGITTVQDEFLAQIVLPTGPTVGEWFSPQLESAYQANVLPALLPGRADAPPHSCDVGGA